MDFLQVEKVCHCILIDAPAGARHWSHSCVAALDKGKTIVCELRLAVKPMANSHLQHLHVTLHQP